MSLWTLHGAVSHAGSTPAPVDNGRPSALSGMNIVEKAAAKPVNIVRKIVHRRPTGVAPTKARIAMPDKPKEEVKVGTDIEPIVVLDLIMPNGRRMRDCTGAEIKRLLKRAKQFKKA